jgi:hypothetical protein
MKHHIYGVNTEHFTYFIQCNIFSIIKTPDDGPLWLKHVVRRRRRRRRRSEISYF